MPDLLVPVAIGIIDAKLAGIPVIKAAKKVDDFVKLQETLKTTRNSYNQQSKANR